MRKIFVILLSTKRTIVGCSIDICYCKIMERLLSALSWGLLLCIWLFNKLNEFLWFSQMHHLWLWKILMWFQTIYLTMILRVINLVLQSWIIPHLVFIVLRQYRQNVQDNIVIVKYHMKIWIKDVDFVVHQVLESPIWLYHILL